MELDGNNKYLNIVLIINSILPVYQVSSEWLSCSRPQDPGFADYR